jgi:hypothetical protein
MKPFSVENRMTGDDAGEFDTIDEARKAARKLQAYAIYNGNGRRVEFCNPPHEMETPDDTPSLDHPWWETER